MEIAARFDNTVIVPAGCHATSGDREYVVRMARQWAREMEVPCIRAERLPRGAAVRRWGLPNTLPCPTNTGELLFGALAGIFVDDDNDGQRMLVVLPRRSP